MKFLLSNIGVTWLGLVALVAFQVTALAPAVHRASAVASFWSNRASSVQVLKERESSTSLTSLGMFSADGNGNMEIQILTNSTSALFEDMYKGIKKKNQLRNKRKNKELMGLPNSRLKFAREDRIDRIANIKAKAKSRSKHNNKHSKHSEKEKSIGEQLVTMRADRGGGDEKSFVRFLRCVLPLAWWCILLSIFLFVCLCVREGGGFLLVYQNQYMHGLNMVLFNILILMIMNYLPSSIHKQA